MRKQADDYINVSVLVPSTKKPGQWHICAVFRRWCAESNVRLGSTGMCPIQEQLRCGDVGGTRLDEPMRGTFLALCQMGDSTAERKTFQIHFKQRIFVYSNIYCLSNFPFYSPLYLLVQEAHSFDTYKFVRTNVYSSAHVKIQSQTLLPSCILQPFTQQCCQVTDMKTYK